MFDVVALPAFSDNYLWLLFSATHAVVVDPGDAEVVERALAQRSLALAGILLTHHHDDHSGGAAALAAAHGCAVYGPQRPDLPVVTHPVRDGDRLELLGTSFIVLALPGHTRDHLGYWCEPAQAVFCGDTLFASGCGRLFEGTPAQMHASLQRLAALPPATRVYCAHEYTVANLRFAKTLAPDDAAIEAALGAALAARAAGRPTVPTTVAQELRENPFLRCGEPVFAHCAERLVLDPPIAQRVQAQPAATGEAGVFAVLRAAKDLFRT